MATGKRQRCQEPVRRSCTQFCAPEKANSYHYPLIHKRGESFLDFLSQKVIPDEN